MNKINILHLVPGLDAGGISTLLLNYYKKMDRTKINFDFAIFYDYIGLTGKEFEKMGSKIYFLPKKSDSLKKYLKALEKILKENKYDIVHVHHNYLSFFALMIAKKCGVKVRISHSHTTEVDELSFKQQNFYFIGKTLNNFFVTHKFACGEKAGEFLYGKKAVKKNEIFILNNAININDYVYNEKVRRKKREDMGWTEKFIIGNVGRLSNQKNQKFALDIIKELVKENKNARLVIVGNGELEEELKKYSKTIKVDKYVEFLGKRSDVKELLQAMDVFILPSLYEGLPVSGVEAITTSIPCVFSDEITKEIDLRENIDYIPITDVQAWKNKILKYKNFKREENSKKIMMEKYDIDNNAKLLESKYIKIVEELEK